MEYGPISQIRGLSVGQITSHADDIGPFLCFPRAQGVSLCADAATAVAAAVRGTEKVVVECVGHVLYSLPARGEDGLS